MIPAHRVLRSAAQKKRTARPVTLTIQYGNPLYPRIFSRAIAQPRFFVQPPDDGQEAQPQEHIPPPARFFLTSEKITKATTQISTKPTIIVPNITKPPPQILAS